MAKDGVNRKWGILVIGGSAGSLEVLINMLNQPPIASLPIVIVLHRKSSADSILTQVLAGKSGMRVKEAEEKETIQGGTVYLAPPDYHLLVERDRTFSLDYSEKVNFSRPSIDVTFESVAHVYAAEAIGILLSGGNADGVEGLLSIKGQGGLCVVQDPRSAEMSFMPGQAVSSNAADLILNANQLAGFVNSLG